MAKLEPGQFCPLIKTDCIGLPCILYTQLRGTHPQTGAEVDEWLCALAALPMLLIETSKEVRQGAAATESFRNEMATSANASCGVMAIIAQGMLQQHATPYTALIGDTK